MGDGTVTEPMGLGALSTYFDLVHPLVQVWDITDVDLDIMVGDGDRVGPTFVQDLSGSTSERNDVPFTDPHFDMSGAFDISLEMGPDTLILHSATFGGDLDPTGEALESVVLRAQLDVRGLGFDADETCWFLATLGSPCFSCPSDGDAYCVSIEVAEIPGTWVPGLDLVSVP